MSDSNYAWLYPCNELYHHGIKGQRWGVRRYMNPDGTLTEEGKARYGTVENFHKMNNRSLYEKARDMHRKYEANKDERYEHSVERGRILHERGYSTVKNVLKAGAGLTYIALIDKVNRNSEGLSKKTAAVLSVATAAIIGKAIYDQTNYSRYKRSEKFKNRDSKKGE